MRLLIIIFIILTITNCSSDNPTIEDQDNTPGNPGKDNCILKSGWLIDPSLIVGGGVGKDGIPSLENPEFISAEEANYLNDNDLVIGLNTGDQILLFPHRIIDRHEIVNSQTDALAYTLTFCPLTGSAIGFRRPNDETFGVSGLLHNSNLIYFNRNNDNYWSQMKLTSIRGKSVCETFNVLNLIEMNWKGWRQQPTDFRVLSQNTGFDKDYSQSFSELIARDDTPLWPYSPLDNRLENFESVYVLFIGDKPKAYPLEHPSSSLSITKDAVLGTKVIIVTDKENELITAFYDDGGEYSIERRSNGIIISQQNKSWDIFGRSINEHEDLKKPNGYTAYWFSVGAMFPQIELYNQDGKD